MTPSSAHPPCSVPTPLRGDKTHITVSQPGLSSELPPVGFGCVLVAGPVFAVPIPQIPVPRHTLAEKRLHPREPRAMLTSELAALQPGV